MRFLSTFKPQMSAEICFPCVLFMTLGTWKIGVDVCCRCSLRARSICTLITHKPVLCGVSQKWTDMLSSSWTPFISQKNLLSTYSSSICRKNNRYSVIIEPWTNYTMSIIKSYIYNDRALF